MGQVKASAMGSIRVRMPLENDSKPLYDAEKSTGE